ncbi:hypothetical protein [Haloarchaeobius sp. HME9146]|uniref:hypothetical protein n=1 Tax=Haloarchaeobius sp. HME9146 TaxID=2978732 RepID=UPI0021BED262|nr:hypothetical protein [Haloarchaeobius sp. HME9146]MCT9098177.1 hypothetical protein [Haloarchaeobius sp. HME9146]
MRRGRFFLVVCLTVAIGVMLRTLTLYESPLPFNPDGLVYAGHVRDARAAGELLLANLATDELHFTMFLAMISEVTGVKALYHSQWVISVVGTLPALFLLSVIRRLGGSLGLDAGQARLAGGLAGLTLAIEGLYLHRSMPVDEQTVGLFLVPLAVIGVVRAHRDSRWWIVVGSVFVVLPAIHNLDAMVFALTLTVLAGLALGTAGRLQSRELTLLALGYWGWFATYNYGLEALTGARIIQQARITQVPGLLFAWVVLVAVALLWFLDLDARFQRGFVGAIFGSWFLLLGVNTMIPVFPGLWQTNWIIVAGGLPLAIPFGLSALGVGDTVEDGVGHGLLGLLGGAIVLIGLSFSAALTADYINLLYRVQTFVHLPVLGLAGYVLVRLVRGWSFGVGAKQIAIAMLVVSASASIPIAFGELEVLSYKGVTTPTELEAAGFAVEYSGGDWTSDDHLTRVSLYYTASLHERSGAGSGPAYEWIVTDRQVDCLLLSQTSWNRVGAQLYPKQPVVVERDRYSRFHNHRNQVYSISSTETIQASLPMSVNPKSC